MSNFVHIARQSIVSRNNTILGYEILHRNDEGVVDSSIEKRELTAKVMLSVFNLIGRERVVGDYRAFFNVDAGILLTDIIESFPTKQCVFEIDASSTIGNKEFENIRKLSTMGYEFAFDNFVVTGKNIEANAKILPFVKYLKVNAQINDVEYVATRVKELSKRHVLIAQKIESADELSAYKEIGFNYFQGFYIHRPQAIKHYKIEPKHLGLTRLYKMVSSVPIEEFAKELEKHNELCVQFFQYLTSTRRNRYNATHSIRAVVVEAGFDVINGWLMLIIYAKGSRRIDEKKGALSQFYIRRIELMSAIVSKTHNMKDKKYLDELRLLTIFSILRDIYKVSFDTLLESFEVDESLELWLVARKGRFEMIYKAVNLLEAKSVDVERVNTILRPFWIDYDEVHKVLRDKQ